MTSGAVLAIDQGTSGTKAVVVDFDEGAVAAAEVPVHPRYLADGGVEQDPAELLDSVVAAGREAVARAGRPIGAVALANQGETVLAWDRRTGRPLSPAIVWQDRRSARLCSELAEYRQLLSERTGLVLDPYFSAPKMAWLRQNVTRDGVVTTTDSWLVHHLCGEFVTDPTTASRSLLLDLDSLRWDPELLELFRLTDEELPHLVGCDEPVGSTTAFGGDVTVGGLMVDQQAALLAEGCLLAGDAKCTFGTGAFLLANTGAPAVRSAAGLTASLAWRTRDETSYCLDGQVYTAASAIRWLADLGLIGHAGELDGLAAGGSGGVLCVPALAGLAAPWWRPDATASFTGITLGTGRGQLAAAVLEGVAAQVAELTDVVAADLGRPLQALRVDGGLARSQVLMQAVADLAQLPIELYPSPHATALGAAALGRMALHADLTLTAAVPEWTPAARFEPTADAGRAAEFRARWRAVAETTLPPADTKDQR